MVSRLLVSWYGIGSALVPVVDRVRVDRVVVRGVAGAIVGVSTLVSHSILLPRPYPLWIGCLLLYA